ncbi:oxidoreductase [Marinomonas ushuaiensis DSM 15871]|uniref:2-oxoglutarate-dependent ethylene/succinate-forming enzyme n=1 Tax=Marinomonas ushuaiensis DSM 15871 TaxID=1122207 RepID=X7E8N0_9GAMM|nr:2-oxoglutarate and iron-dependent oxygenase domain-containing protein [Marinomonas ushuaiensis]ETX11503.1 oxidoreductase [Marinomonas ushuaiensis DSM 15871]
MKEQEVNKEKHENGLPIINIEGYATATPEKLLSLAKEIGHACRDKGFFYITGHGIDASLIKQLTEEAKSFFNLSDAEKMRLDKKHSTANRGYEPIRNQTLEAGAPPDFKEGLYIGIEHGDDHPMVKAGRFNYGQNQWPKNAQYFQKAATQYIHEMTELAKSLMSLLALSLELPKDYFSEFNHDPTTLLRMLHYPPQPKNPLPNEKGCGAHTDFGGLTLLLQDDNGGLQVWDRKNDAWIEAQPIEGSFIVNLGDMISRWTNDKYNSTLHRVINTSGKARYSMPFFYSGNPDHIVSCLPTCLEPNSAPKYPPISVESHMRDMYKKTYSGNNNEK